MKFSEPALTSASVSPTALVKSGECGREEAGGKGGEHLPGMDGV